MKIIFIPLMYFMSQFFSSAYIWGQDSLESSDWKLKVQTDFYFSETFFVIPIISVVKDKLHLEARYLNEEVETASVWLGYRISGGNEFEYLFTPMIGGAFGRINGLAAELDFTLNLNDFEFENELEYVFDVEAAENIFYYSIDLSYSSIDWLWFGISGRRARLYQKGLDLQRGLFIGVAYKNLEFTTYLFDIGFDSTFLMLSLAGGF